MPELRVWMNGVEVALWQDEPRAGSRLTSLSHSFSSGPFSCTSR